MNPAKRILKAAGTVGAATLLSRLLGFIRDMTIAWYFPVVARDAFFVAFRLPNTMRRLFGEGAMVISFIPVFSDVVRKDPEEARRVFKISFTLLAIALFVVCGLGMVFARQVIWAFAPGFFDDPEKARLTILLTRVMFPFLLFVSLVALAQGVLNTLDHYYAPAMAPVLLNVSMIVVPYLVASWFTDSIIALALSVLVGGVAMLIFQIPYLNRMGYPIGWSFDLKHEAVRRILYLMGPAAFGLLVYQFNMLISTIFASLLPTGSVSWLFYAQRFTELPLGVFAVAIGTAILPTLSAHLSAGDMDGYKKSYVYGLNLVMFLMIPAMLGLVALSAPIFAAFFQRGEFDHREALASADALIAYAIGLPAIAGSRVTAPAFYARKDTRTPVKIAMWAFGLNLIFSVALMGPGWIFEPIFAKTGTVAPTGLLGQVVMWKGFSHVGLALATTLSAWYNFGALLIGLNDKVPGVEYKAIAKSSVRTTVAGLIMTAVIWAIVRYAPVDWTELGITRAKLAGLLGATAIGLCVFVAASWVIGQNEVKDLVEALRNRRARAATKKTGDKPQDGGAPPPPPIEL